jgi:hypothetical protein
VVEFYRWYLGELAKDRNPLQDDHAKIETYVSKALVQELDRHIDSEEGLDEDYFTRAQDYLEDWASNIAVSGNILRELKSLRVVSHPVTVGFPFVDQRPARRKSDRGQTTRFYLWHWGCSKQVQEPRVCSSPEAARFAFSGSGQDDGTFW